MRSFSWGHAGQLDAVAGEALARAWSAGAGPTDAGGAVHYRSGQLDPRDLRVSRKEGGSRFGYTHVRGYHPLYAIAGDGGEVLHSPAAGRELLIPPGAAVGFLAETFRRVRAGGVTGKLKVRADSGFYSGQGGPGLPGRRGPGGRSPSSCTRTCTPPSRPSPTGAWQPIPYWIDDGADVAAVDWRAFKSRTDEVSPAGWWCAEPGPPRAPSWP